MNKQVTASVVVDDAGLTGQRHVTMLALLWSPEDPLAVVVALSPQPDHPSLPRGTWVVLRDFLRYGCSEPTGDGDVRIRPASGDDPRVLLELHHGRDAKPYSVHVPTDVLCGFLDKTEAVVPAGSEASEDAINELIRRLLDA